MTWIIVCRNFFLEFSLIWHSLTRCYSLDPGFFLKDPGCDCGKALGHWTHALNHLRACSPPLFFCFLSVRYHFILPYSCYDLLLHDSPIQKGYLLAHGNNQNFKTKQSFLFMNWLPLEFCCHNRQLINTCYSWTDVSGLVLRNHTQLFFTFLSLLQLSWHLASPSVCQRCSLLIFMAPCPLH